MQMFPWMEIGHLLPFSLTFQLISALGVYSDQVLVTSINLEVYFSISQCIWSWKYSSPYLNALRSGGEPFASVHCKRMENISHSNENLSNNFETQRFCALISQQFVKEAAGGVRFIWRDNYTTVRWVVGDDLSRDCQLGEERLRCQDCFACSTHSTSETHGNA